MLVADRIYQFLKTNTYLLTVLFCVLCAAIILYIKLKFLVSFHPDISGSERSTTFGIQIVADGLPLYTDPTQSPFWIAQYAPLYYYVVGLPYRWLGGDPTNIHRVQLASRLVSFGLVSLALGVALLTARRVLRINWGASLLLVAVTFGFMQHWPLTNSRVDSLLFLCTTGFLYCGLRAFQNPTDTFNRYVVAAATLAVLAFFAKQSGLIHCICLLGFLVAKSRWTTLAKTAGLMAVLFAVLTLLFSGGNVALFFTNIFGSLVSPLMPVWFYYYTFKPLIPAASVLIATSFLIGLRWFFQDRTPQRQFLALSGLLYFGFATATTFKYGAAVGYYHEYTYTAILLVFWYFCAPEARSSRSLSYYMFLGLVALTMLYFTSGQVERYVTTEFGRYVAAYAEQKAVNDYLKPQLAAQDKLVVVLGDDFRGYLLQQMLFRHQLAYQDDVIHFLNKNKKLDYSRFFAEAKAGGVKYVVLPKPQPLYFSAFDYTFPAADYVLEKDINGYQIYKHK